MKVLTVWEKEELFNLSEQMEKSLMIRYLIHVLGDIHQPLHASELFDNDMFKNGDEGGNLFLIKYNKTISEIDNLHKLFDSGIDRLVNNVTRVYVK
jgi:hypothetical protein